MAVKRCGGCRKAIRINGELYCKDLGNHVMYKDECIKRRWERP